MWKVLTSVRGAGRSSALAAIASIASSSSSSRWSAFQYARSWLRGKSGSNPDCTPVNGVGPGHVEEDGAELAQGLQLPHARFHVAGVNAADDRDRPVVDGLGHLGIRRGT